MGPLDAKLSLNAQLWDCLIKPFRDLADFVDWWCGDGEICGEERFLSRTTTRGY